MKRWHRMLNTPAASVLLTALERAEGREPSVLRVVTYHRVAEPDEYPYLSPSVLSATPGAFRAQMQFVSSAYTPVSVGDVLDFLDGGKALPQRAVLVTFDDAYQCFAQYAWGTLKELGIPVVMFVATAFPDNSTRCFWWDRLHHALEATHEKSISSLGQLIPLRTAAERTHAHKVLRAQVKSLPHETAMELVDRLCEKLQVPDCGNNGVLSWSALRQLAAEGVTLGAHTRTHPLLSRISGAKVEEEAVGSLDDLRKQVGNALPILAYPSGGVTPLVAERLRRAGFRIAFTTSQGVNQLGRADELLLKRNNISRNTSLNLMRVKLLYSFPFGAGNGAAHARSRSEA